MSRVNPSSHEASRRMARVRQKDTRAELNLRRILHARGLRYRLHVPLLTKPRRVVDIVFPSVRIAVFVDGCFWHGCPEHASWPKNNAVFWREKIETNRFRDADTDQRLNALGWKIVRIWEHEDASDAANRIADLVDARRKNGTDLCR
ncbi:very short patch repair endonuclease [Xanthobacter versatilis]|uniref:very short patch repair endonuclease n=1 Tax=Xanthobacter autotrophicus (strain ATCC BAA-1158 / Py2) TaxID=78245 RepID=UPI00372A875B